MYTTSGKMFIKKYMANQAGNAVGAISVGIGSTAAVVGDTRLQFEFARVPVDLIAYDFAADKLIFKGTLLEAVEGKIYEIGLFTDEVNVDAANQQNVLVSTFDQASEAWVGGAIVWETTTARLGADSLSLTAAASTTQSAALSDLDLDLTAFSAADVFTFAYNVNNGNCANIKYRFQTDASNYYEFTIATPTTGYKFTSLTKGSATTVGAPDWQNINIITVLNTSTSGGSNIINYDGIRLDDVDTFSPNYGLIGRYILGAPVTKVVNTLFDIEYTWAVTIT